MQDSSNFKSSSSIAESTVDRLFFPVQKIASGLRGDPVPLSIRSGAAMNRNS